MHTPSLPKMRISKTHIPTNTVFSEHLSNKNCRGWAKCPYEELNMLAVKRIDELNTCMPDTWKYQLIGWETEGETK